ncbi:MAG: hypothetical protein M3Y25_01915 [Thermoproteota archaeon]|nr:hypothetical protein [Thermoproteota archaeon]
MNAIPFFANRCVRYEGISKMSKREWLLNFIATREAKMMLNRLLKDRRKMSMLGDNITNFNNGHQQFLFVK